MKTIIYKVLILSFFCLVGIVQVRGQEVSKEQSLTTTINPQFPYRSSIGGMIAPFGVSIKTFLTDNFAYQTDIFYGAKITRTKIDGIVAYLAVESNTNVMYQKKLKEKKKSELYGLIGGGISLGCGVLQSFGKFEVNTIIGLEYVWKNSPLSFQIDFRPGCGMLFLGKGLAPYSKDPFFHFDWLLGITLRYTFKK